MAPLTHRDLADVRAQWEEWTSGLGFDLDVQVIGAHGPAEMDPDRPLGAVLTAKLSLRLVIRAHGQVIFDEPCPYDGAALRASVKALSREIAASSG